MNSYSFVGCVVWCVSFLWMSVPVGAVPGWQSDVGETRYRSSADGTLQPTLYYWPKAETAVPLLVALHTWSNDYLQPEPAYAEWCIRKGWAMIHPNFRGKNDRPEACGSELAVADILSAVEWAKGSTQIDADRVYLVGVSGGGYASLLMAGRAPQVWAGVSAWAGIYDLADWQRERGADRYAKGIESACGGAPGTSGAVDEQYRRRSASGWLARAGGVPVDIQTGIHDGHRGSVPVSHSLKAFNVLAGTREEVDDGLMREMTVSAVVPERVRFSGVDRLYPRHPVLFRRVSGNVRVTLFEGGHEIVHAAGLAWLERQRRGRPAEWDLGGAEPVSLESGKTDSGK
jgi:pimeloyl-ACP methyl ester carboxylesterase